MRKTRDEVREEVEACHKALSHLLAYKPALIRASCGCDGHFGLADINLMLSIILDHLGGPEEETPPTEEVPKLGSEMIKTVMALSNGLLAVFDENGQQLPEYQGWYHENIDKLREVYSGPIEDHRPYVMRDLQEVMLNHLTTYHKDRHEPRNNEAEV